MHLLPPIRLQPVRVEYAGVHTQGLGLCKLLVEGACRFGCSPQIVEWAKPNKANLSNTRQTLHIYIYAISGIWYRAPNRLVVRWTGLYPRGKGSTLEAASSLGRGSALWKKKTRHIEKIRVAHRK